MEVVIKYPALHSGLRHSLAHLLEVLAAVQLKNGALPHRLPSGEGSPFPRAPVIEVTCAMVNVRALHPEGRDGMDHLRSRAQCGIS